MTITQQIKRDYGSVKRFCILKGISYNTLSRVTTSVGKSMPCVSMLIENGYINDVTDLPQYKEKKTS